QSARCPSLGPDLRAPVALGSQQRVGIGQDIAGAEGAVQLIEGGGTEGLVGRSPQRQPRPRGPHRAERGAPGGAGAIGVGGKAAGGVLEGIKVAPVVVAQRGRPAPIRERRPTGFGKAASEALASVLFAGGNQARGCGFAVVGGNVRVGGAAGEAPAGLRQRPIERGAVGAGGNVLLECQPLAAAVGGD